MSINLVPTPDPAAPITAATGYTRQNALISANEVPKLSILTLWESTGAEPLIKQGTFIRHAGNTYKVETNDEVISGAPAAGINYIELTLTGSVITAAWVTSLAGYSFNQAYGGIYNGAGTPNQIIRDIVFLDGIIFNRGLGFGEDFNSYRLADGTIVVSKLTASSITKLNLTESSELTFSCPTSSGGIVNLPIAGGFSFIAIRYSYTSTGGAGSEGVVSLQRSTSAGWITVATMALNPNNTTGAGSNSFSVPMVYAGNITDYRVAYNLTVGSFTGLSGTGYYKTV